MPLNIWNWWFILKRKIYEQLLHWKREDQGRTALLVEGARRVGKSHIVEEFGKTEYKSYLIIDFNRVEASVTDLFNTHLNDLDSFFFTFLATSINHSLIGIH